MRAFSLLLVTSTIALQACAPAPEPSPPEPVFAAAWTVDGDSVDSVAFPDTAFGAEVTRTISLENRGDVTFTLTSRPSIVVDGAASSFAIGALSSVTVPPERPLLVPITFRPDGTGPLSATLRFSTVYGDGPVVVVDGVGTDGDGTSGVDVECWDGAFELLPDFDELGEPATTSVQRSIGIPGNRVGTDQFACRFRAVLAVPVTGAWTLSTVADDGVQLLIDDDMVVDDDGTHGAREVDGEVALTAGDHDIEVRYFEAGGGESLEVRWQGPERQREAIPAAALRRR